MVNNDARDNCEQLRPFADIIAGALSRLCGSIDSELMNAVLASANVCRLRASEVLYQQGNTGSSMHIVLTGRLQVEVSQGGGSHRVIAFPQPGDAVGEMALLSGGNRAATVSAVRDSVLAEITRSDLDWLIKEKPDAFRHIAKMIIERMTGLQGRIARREGARSFMLLPLHESQGVREFASVLRTRLLAFGSVLHLNAARAIQRFGAFDHDRYALALDDCEGRYEHLVLEAEPAPTEWTQLCFGYADTILLIADAARVPDVTPIEEALLGSREDQKRLHARIELVLLHAAAGKPRATEHWLSRRTVARHHHVRRDCNGDTDRLARFLTGNAIGLVLAGGGARGFAHLGVIRAMQEAGIPIDAVAGASFGALVATGPARDLSHERMFTEQFEVFAQGDPLGDYTIPIVSLVRGVRLDGILESRLTERIEDLFVPFYAVSSDLSENCVRVHATGPLWKAVRASLSLPAILPPTLHDGHLLVDGGVLNNLPVDVLRDQMRGPIIAVDLAAQRSPAAPLRHIPSSTDYLKSRLLQRRHAVEAPTVSRIIMQVTTLASRKEVQRARSIADLYLTPPTSGHDFLDWRHMKEIVAIGHQYSKPLLEDWRNRRTQFLGRDELVSAWRKFHEVSFES